MRKSEKKKRCFGCRANRYNMGRGFVENPQTDAPVNCDECWHLETARPCNKLVYYSPGDYQPFLRANTLSCWHNNMGHGTITKRRK